MPLAFRPERITPRARDPDFRDRDELAVGPNLFGCDSRHALSDQRGNHTGVGPWALSHACATPSWPEVASMARARRASALRGQWSPSPGERILWEGVLTTVLHRQRT